MPLTDTELAVLDLERGWFRHAGAKETVIWERFGWTPTRYSQVLNRVLDRSEAEAYDAVLVRRLRRVRDGRRAARRVDRSTL